MTTSSRNELKVKIYEKVNSVYRSACEMFDIEELGLLVFFDKKSRSVAGTANFEKRELNFNMKLAEENEEEFLKETVGHEVAHIVAHQVFGKNCKHNKNWKYIMVKMGLKPEIYHKFITAKPVRRKVQKFSYSCECGRGVHKISKNLHTKITKGSGKAYCRKCNKIIFRLVSDIYPN